MRFLCVECDEPMSMDRTRGPDEGSMTVFFACPDCGRETAMLTNAMETQVVRSLGVSIGGRDEAPGPMETVRSRVGNSAGRVSEEDGDASHAVPESGTDSEIERHVPSGNADASAGESGGSGESKCPFTGTVEAAYADQGGSAQGTDVDEAPADRSGEPAPPEDAQQESPRWTQAAEKRLERIPPMARTMARRGIEEYAREEGLDTIDESVMDDLKGQFRI